MVDKIKEGKESALLSHKLATIKKDVPIDVDIGEITEGQFKTPEAFEKLRELGFNSLIKRLEKRDPPRLAVARRREAGKDKKEDGSEQLALV